MASLATVEGLLSNVNLRHNHQI